MHHPLHKVKKFIQASLALIIFIFLSVAPQNSWSQIQLGADIDGEAIDNRSGKSVAISSDGSRIAVGATFNSGNGSHSGHVRIFEWNGAAWIQLGLDIDGEAAGDRSGNSVSLSGDGSRVAIGAPYNDGNGSESGHVRVFEWNGTAWIQLGTDIDGEAADDLFGQSVSLSVDGNRLAVGAPHHGGFLLNGHTKIFEWDGSAWIQMGSDIDGAANYDRSGYSVSLSASGSIVAIGSYRHGSDIEGHVRIYAWNGAAWFQRGSDIDGEGMFDESGSSVSLSSDGSRVAISALYNDGNGVDAGHVRVFGWNGSNWSQVGADLDGEAAGDGFGEGVSMSADGSRVAIGAPSNDGNGSGAGHVRIYEWDGSSWNQWGSDINGEAAGDFSGESVSLSGDGSRVIIGASSNSNLNGVSAGHARIFDVNATDGVPPTASTQNKTVYLDGSGNASIVPADVDDGSFDNVGITSYSLDINTFDCDDLAAPVIVTLTVEDAAGNDDSETAQVTVLDTIAPIRTLNNYTLQLDATGNATLLGTDVTSGVSDNCAASPTITLGQTAFDCTDIGIQTITVTVSDGTNSRGGSVQVTVEDNVAPVVTRNDATIYLDASGNASLSAGQVASAVSDNCDGAPAVALGQTAFNATHLGANTVTVNVTDLYGNANYGSVTVTVLDTMAPVRTLNNHTLYLDASGNATLAEGDVTSGVSDNAGGTPTITLGQTAFNCSDAASSPVTVSVSVSDGANSRGGSVQVTVLDTVAPTYNTTAATKVLSTLTGQVTLLEGDVINSIVDACDGSPAVNISKTDFNCSDIGANTVMVTVTDTYGNSRSQAVSVTIEHHPVVNANFEIVRDTACVVTVYNTSTDYNHLTWAWGDGSFTHTREVDTVQHTYTDIDDFIITLTAFDTCDYTSTHVDTVRIWPYLHNNTTDTSCTDEPYSVIDADCISIALIEWEKDGSVYKSERPANHTAGTVCAGGNGGGARNAQFRSNAGIAINPTNGHVVVADKFNHRVMSWSCGASSGTRIAGAVSHSGNPHPGSRNDQLRYPQDVFVDAAGNLYVADMGNHRVMKYAPGASAGVRVAGGGTGVGRLNSPTGVVVAANGDIYVADQGNHRIVRYTSTDTTVVAGVTGVSSRNLNHLNKPWDIVLASNGDMIIAEYGNHRVMRWTPGAASGTVIAGGQGFGQTLRHLAGPKGVSLNRYDELFIVDYHNDRIVKWQLGATQGVRVAGNVGTGSNATQVLYPEGLVVDNMGRMWISDTRNHRVMKWDVDPVALTHLTDGTANYTVRLELEDGRNVVVDSTIYFERVNNVVAAFTYTTSGLHLDVTDASTDDEQWVWSWGNGDSAFVEVPGTYTYSQPGTYEVCLMVTDSCGNTDTTCQMITVTAAAASLAAGAQANACDEVALTVSGPSASNVLRVEWYKDAVLMGQGATGIDTVGVTVAGSNGGGSALHQFKTARRVYVDALGNVFVSEKDNNRISMWAPNATTGVLVAGGSRGSQANQLSWPMGVTMNANGELLIADTYNNRIQKVSLGNLTATTVAGGNGGGSGLEQLNRPSAVAVASNGEMYIADENNHRIVKYAVGAGIGTVVAGTGSAGSGLHQLNKPSDIKIAGNYFYVADRENHRVMRWPLTAVGGDPGVVVAGGNGWGSGDHQLKQPEALSVDPSGAVYISDYGNNRLQIWLPGSSSGHTRVGGAAVGRGSAAHQLNNPEGLYAAPDGTLYCVDKGNNRVQRYAAQGSASQMTQMSNGSGSYHAVVFYTDGSSVTTNSVSVTVAAADAGSWTYSTTDLDMTITSASPVGSSYTWYFGDSGSSSALMPVHSYAAAGTYEVCLVAVDACGNTDSSCQMVTVTAPAVPMVGNGSGANDQAGSNGPDGDLSSSAEGAIAQISWDVYPNPTDGWLQISASMKGATVELMDLQGRVMETHRMEDYSMTLDLSDRARGTYMIRLIHAGGVHMERIILD